MKVLWFSNTPANADEYFNKELKGTGGWLKSLDKELQNKVKLSVAFYFNKQVSNFKYGNTDYYPIIRNDKFLQKVKNRLTANIVVDEDTHKYLDIINLVKPDIIHIHGTENPFGKILDNTNIPIVISIQGNITVCFHKYYTGIEKKYSKIANNLALRLLGDVPFYNTYNRFNKMKVKEQQVLGKCNNVIGRTDWDRRVTSILAKNARYFHNNEILRDGFYINHWNNNNNEKLIVFTTSGNVFYKGLETIAYTVSLLLESGFKDFEWKVAGISENSLIVKAVRSKLKSNYPKSNLLFLGSLDEDDLLNNLLNSDLYIMPSHIENSPNNLCEAMILGMPCIATFVGGTSSLMTDKEEGVLIQDGDPWAMAGAIKEFNDNKSIYHRYAKNARKRALKRHNKELISNELIDIYKSIIE